MEANKEIELPWVKYPTYPPGDTFWRQAGEAWLALIWEPYWKSLSLQQQEEYLIKWKAPESWRLFYFDSEFNEWLQSTDD